MDIVTPVDAVKKFSALRPKHACWIAVAATRRLVRFRPAAVLAASLASALLFCEALIHGREGWMGYGAAVIYVFTTAVHTSALGALLTFSQTLWYPSYQETTAAWGLTPVEDQQLGGLIMWVPAGVVYLVAGLLLFALWLRESERRALRREAAPERIFRAGAICALLSFSAIVAGCRRGVERDAAAMTGGDPARGKTAITRYGCAACHQIRGVIGAQGLVGPPLEGVARRAYIGGVLGNSPDNMIRWVQNPQAVDQKTAMPNLGVTDADARDIAAYLYTLR